LRSKIVHGGSLKEEHLAQLLPGAERYLRKSLIKVINLDEAKTESLKNIRKIKVCKR